MRRLHRPNGVTISNSTISGNRSVVAGGGVATLGGGVTLRNATLVDNVISSASGGGVTAARDRLFTVHGKKHPSDA